MNPIILLLALSFAPPAAHSAKPSLLKKVGSCKAVRSGPGAKLPAISIIKQWHLDPALNTKNPMKKQPDQAANLGEIEKELGQWITQKKLNTLIAEGCEGKFEETPAFNGWTFAELKTKAANKAPDFDQALTHPALKLEAKYGDAVDTRCGDDQALIKAELLAFSDSRADIGYLMRIEQNKEKPDFLKPYLEGIIETYHLPKDASIDQAQVALKEDLKKSVDTILDLNQKRSAKLAHAAMEPTTGSVAIIVGGLHSSEIVSVLEKAKRNCVVYEPKSYKQNEEELLKQLQSAVKTKP